MCNEILNKLIASGEAQFGTAIFSGGLCLMKVPSGKGLVITQLRLKAFADLTPGVNFSNKSDVVNNSWHQLRVIGERATNIFNARHDLFFFTQAGVELLIPEGETVWDVFLNHENNILFELSHWGAQVLAIASATLPAGVESPIYGSPPDGYGRTGVAGSIATVSTIDSIVAGSEFEIRNYGTYTAPSVPNNKSYGSFQWPVNAITALNPPQPTIPYGTLTFPVLSVQFVLYNKRTNSTYSAPFAM